MEKIALLTPSKNLPIFITIILLFLCNEYSLANSNKNENKTTKNILKEWSSLPILYVKNPKSEKYDPFKADKEKGEYIRLGDVIKYEQSRKVLDRKYIFIPYISKIKISIEKSNGYYKLICAWDDGMAYIYYLKKERNLSGLEGVKFVKIEEKSEYGSSEIFLPNDSENNRYQRIMEGILKSTFKFINKE